MANAGELHNDGRGFDPAENGARGGLQVMRQRLEELGGLVDIESASGGGTTIAVTIVTVPERVHLP